MKYINKLIACGAALMVSALVTDLQAQVAKQSKIKVRNVRGEAQYKANAAANWAPLKTGTVLTPGAIVETGKNSMVDLWLVEIMSVVRITEATQMGLDKLNYTKTEDEVVVETELNLKAGTILGNVKKLAAASRYDVKIPNGVCGIRGTEFKITVAGIVYCISGSIRVTYTPPAGGAPIVRDLTAGQVFYPPTDGQPARVDSIPPTDPVWIEIKGLPEPVITDEHPPVVVIPLEPTTKPTAQHTTGEPESSPTHSN